MHINEADLRRLIQNKTLYQEKINMLTHISECSECENKYFEMFDNVNMAPCPKISYRFKSKTREFYEYSFKVAAGVAAAIALLLTGAFQNYSYDYGEVSKYISNANQYITQMKVKAEEQRYSQQKKKMEEFFNEQK